MPASRPVVAVLTTGGTIASRPTPSGGVVAAATGGELLSSIPGLDEVAEVRIQDLLNVGGYLMAPRDMLAVARRVRELEGTDVAGVVVTHGTDTMEETVYLVDLLYAGEKPVVFTGAQRNAAAFDADGPRNLRDAVRVAADPAARGLGAVICMGSTVEAAREATKVHTTDPRAFASPGYGPVGAVTDDAVRVFRQRRRPTNLARHLPASLPRVDLVKLVAGSDGTFLRAAREAGAAGLIIEAFGIGNANHAVLAEVRAAVEAGVAVIVVSRCPEGSVAPVYGNGGGHDLREAGAVFGGDLGGPKARVLLMAALAVAESTGEPLEDLLLCGQNPTPCPNLLVQEP